MGRQRLIPWMATKDHLLTGEIWDIYLLICLLFFVHNHVELLRHLLYLLDCSYSVNIWSQILCIKWLVRTEKDCWQLDSAVRHILEVICPHYSQEFLIFLAIERLVSIGKKFCIVSVE